MIRFFTRLTGIILLLILPFVVLVRGAVYFHEKYDPGAFPSLIGGIAMTVVVLVIYMTLVYSRFTTRLGTIGGFKSRGLFAVILLIGFCIHGLFFISSKNMKSEEINTEIRDLHPLCRIALSTVIYLDKDLIITDTRRTPEDYRKMGLPSNSSSLHYQQKDGYAYAFDLRTNKRSEVRNFCLRNYFRLMGFQTLRHVGTDDHLHISLRCHYLPGSI